MAFPESNIDWSKYIQSLESRANLSLNNLSPEGEAKLGKGALIESYTSGISGYNIYSNGYCEQWGESGPDAAITFLKKFKDTNYIFLYGLYIVVQEEIKTLLIVLLYILQIRRAMVSVLGQLKETLLVGTLYIGMLQDI